MLRRNALQSVGWNRGNPCQLLSQPGGGDAVVIAASESYSSFLDKCTHGFFPLGHEKPRAISGDRAEAGRGRRRPAPVVGTDNTWLSPG